MRSALQILRKPRITEKTSERAEAGRVTVFEVPVDAKKDEIKAAVEAAFDVEVQAVRTMIVRGKTKRRGRIVGKANNWKKAIVTLKEGHEINLYGAA